MSSGPRAEPWGVNTVFHPMVGGNCDFFMGLSASLKMCLCTGDSVLKKHQSGCCITANVLKRGLVLKTVGCIRPEASVLCFVSQETLHEVRSSLW